MTSTTVFREPTFVEVAHGVLIHAAQWLGRSPQLASTHKRLESARVREMARGLQFSDPGFASDLCAAADRHEQDADQLV